MTALTDKFRKVAAADTVTQMDNPGKAIGASSFNIVDSTGWPTDTAIDVGIRIVDAQGKLVPGTYTEWKATLSGNTLSLGVSPTPSIGSDQNYPSGATTEVYVANSATRVNDMVDALLQSLNQDGSLQSAAILNALGGGIVPTGAITPYGGSSAPTGYLLCDGSAVNRTTYASLFTAIGTNYGSGNGTTTFNLPDLRQKFPLGKAASGTGNALGATGGNIDHQHTMSAAYAEMETDSTGIYYNGRLVSPDSPWSIGGKIGFSNTNTTPGGTGVAGMVIGGKTDANNAPFQVVNYIIKT